MQIFVPGTDDYEATPLTQVMALDGAGQLLAADPGRDPVAAIVAWIVPQREPNRPKRALLLTLGDRVLLNGQVPYSMAVLRRGDEIRLGDKSFFHTDEDPLRIVAYDGLAQSGTQTTCSRCHRPFLAGEPVIACPLCGLLYMAQPDKNPSCWTFGPCLGCQRDPQLEFVWRPQMQRLTERRRSWTTPVNP